MQEAYAKAAPLTHGSTVVDLIQGARSFGEIRFLVLVTHSTQGNV